MDAVRAMPPNSLPTNSNGTLPTDSLAVFLMDATVPANEIVVNGFINALKDDDVHEFADSLEPGVVAFRHAIGTVGGADDSFWTPAARGEGSLFDVRSRSTDVVQTMAEPDEPEPGPRRRWMPRRRH